MNLLQFLFGVKTGSRRLTVATRDSVKTGWQNVQSLVASRNPSSLKQAVVLSDKILDAVLKDLVAGETEGDRLKEAKARELFSSQEIYNKAWDAHKMRNSLVHEVNYDPPYYVCNDAVSKFGEVLRDLRAL